MKHFTWRAIAAVLMFSGLSGAAAEDFKAYDGLKRLLPPGIAAGTANRFSTLTPPAAPVAADTAVAYTEARARQLAAMANSPLQQIGFRDGGMDGQDLYFYWGAPKIVRKLKPADVGVMRHWTSNGQVNGTPVVDLIVKSGLLKAGPRMYIIPESHRADYYYDLHGVFYTTPDFPAGELWMNLRPDSDFVDFTVNPGMGTLYLAPGNYLFPCPQNIPAWIADAYKKWKQTGVLPAGSDTVTFAQIDREGGLHDPLDIPITVVQYQKNGKITVLRPDLLKKPY